MKCTACGENNVDNARFCAFCGAKLDTTRHLPVVEPANEAKATEKPASEPAKETAQPLGDNPIQPVRRSMPHLYGERPTATADYTVLRPRESRAEKARPEPQGEQPQEEPLRPNRAQSVPPRREPEEKKVFLFDDEIEEEKQKKWEEEDRQRKEAFKKQHSAPDDDLFYDEEDEEYGEDIEDDEGELRGGRVFIKVISALTVVALIAAIAGFLFATSLGGRLRAQWGVSWDYQDYLNLAAWEQQSGNLSGASDAYLNAFKLKNDDYDVALQIAYGFEACSDTAHAESMYTFLIRNYPNRDEPYDHLMALLYTQGRLSEYEALLSLREQNQPGYQGATAYQPPVASPESGTYAGEVQLTLTAEKAQEIRYTLDDTQPTAQSLLYTGPIHFGPGSYSVRAVAVYENGTLSAQWSGFYSVTAAAN